MPYIKEDVVIYPYLEQIKELIKTEKIVKAVEDVIGPMDEPANYQQPKLFI